MVCRMHHVSVPLINVSWLSDEYNRSFRQLFATSYNAAFCRRQRRNSTLIHCTSRELERRKSVRQLRRLLQQQQHIHITKPSEMGSDQRDATLVYHAHPPNSICILLQSSQLHICKVSCLHLQQLQRYTMRYDTIRYCVSTYSTCSKKLTAQSTTRNKRKITRTQLSPTDRASAAHRIRYRFKYYTVTLKHRSRVTQGHWKRNH